MSVDYIANYGIGIRVILSDENHKKEGSDEKYYEILDELLPDHYYYFQTGDGNYTGEENEWYVVLDSPKFIDGVFDGSSYKRELEDILSKDFKLGEFGLVGGLLIW